jgi:sn1-specific diacylglycerol lipase
VFATNNFSCITASTTETSLANWLYAYVISTLLQCALSLILETMILLVTNKGTVIDANPRSALGGLIKFKILVMVPLNLVTATSGFPPTFLIRCHETSSLPKLAQVLLFSSQLFELLLTSCCFYVLRGRPMDSGDGRRRRLGTAHVETEWENCCRFLCNCSAVVTCFLFGGGESGTSNQYAMVGRVLADYFEDGGTLDIVPSDVAAGLIMLRHLQKSREWKHRQSRTQSFDHKTIEAENASVHGDVNAALFGGGPVPSTPEAPTFTSEISSNNAFSSPSATKSSAYWYRVANRPTLDPNNMIDRMAMDEAARFSRHALSIYTWMLYVFMHPITGVPSLARQRLSLSRPCCCCSCCDDSEPEAHISSDNCCRSHMSALLAQANLDESEVAYAHFGNSVVENPYCVIIDHKWRSVVIAIRGTLSLEDCITDALAESLSLAGLGKKYGFDGEGEYAHAGMIISSEWIMEHLAAHQTLEKAFAEHPTYQLRVTGHSLGAGCALILSLMLRKTYPNLRCLPYSPPGGLVTMKTARACSEWTTSYILSNDIVPRLSVESMEHLRDETLEIIARIKVNKMTVLKTAILGPSGEERSELMEDLMDDLDAPAPESEFSRQLAAFKAVQETVRKDRGRTGLQMYPPGKIVHFVKTDEGKFCGCGDSCFGRVCKCIGGRKRQYTPIWARNDDFTEIVISPSMMLDHFPDRVCVSIEQTADDWGIAVEPGSLLSKRAEPVGSGRDGNASPMSDDPLIDPNAGPNQV